jgi:hypothetical protein
VETKPAPNTTSCATLENSLFAMGQSRADEDYNEEMLLRVMYKEHYGW